MIRITLLVSALIASTACHTWDASVAAHRASDGEVPAGEVLFEFTPGEPAESVTLTGDFLDWDPSGAEMTDDDGDGTWTVIQSLTPGPYLYKFIVDGSEWLHDPANPQTADDDHEGYNSVLRVVE